MTEGRPRPHSGAIYRSGQAHARDSKDCPARRCLDEGYASAVEHHEPITMGGAKRTGVFCQRLDDSLDHLSLAAVILERDVDLVTAHQANPQLYLCDVHTRVLSRRPNP